MAGRDRVVTLLRRTRDLTPGDWDDIWALTNEFYDVERGYAETELRKRENIALFRVAGALLGMASITAYTATFRGQDLAILNTTHVLIRETGRGRNLLQKLGFRMFLRTRLRHPLRPIYWFFDTFSYKSYLLLPRNFRRFWPRHDEPTPEDRVALIDQLATDFYGPAWRPSRGIAVRSGQKRLRAAAAPLTLTPDSSPDIRFFATANPGHAEGDLLICLCPLSLGNWFHLARRAVARSGRAQTR